jgi:hypothetical protein
MSKKPTVSHEDFVVAWMTSETLDDVVKNTGMSKGAVRLRAKLLKDKGVRLKALARPASLDRLRIAQLNSLVNRYVSKDSTQTN